MSRTYNLAFISEALDLKWFRLNNSAMTEIASSQNLASECSALGHEAKDKNSDDETNVLILPSSCGLPFQIELPFGDPEKIKKVVPQFVADQYSEVDETWLFSWKLLEPAPDAERQFWKISGLAFPKEFSPATISPETTWRLALPDVYLLWVKEMSAFRLETPGADFVAIYSGKDQINRIFRDPSIPLAPVLSAEGLADVEDKKLVDSPGEVFSRIEEIFTDSGFLDLSGWHQKKFVETFHWSAASIAAMIVGLIFVGHFFLWFECYLTESAAQRTVLSRNASFSTVFPGVPIIDAVSQIKRKISEAENSLKEAGSVPNVPWFSVLQLASGAKDSDVRLIKVVGRDKGFRFQGAARDYTSLEDFRKRLESSDLVEEVITPESRKNGSEVIFAMEGKWKS